MGNCFKNTDLKNDESKTPYVKTAIPMMFKALVWDEYIGREYVSGPCFCCGSTIMRDPTKNKKQSYHCGHVTAERETGELWLGNCRPVCRSCNSSMGTKHMADYYRNMPNVDFAKLAGLRASLPRDPQTPYRKAIAQAVLGNVVELAISQEQIAAFSPRATHTPYIAESIYDHYVTYILNTMFIDDLHFIARTIQPNCSRTSRQKLIDIIMPVIKNVQPGYSLLKD